jgi:hypothetical protein
MMFHITQEDVFYALLNVAGINAQVIFASYIETQMKRRQFLKSLAMDLMKEYRAEHAACSHLSRELLTKLKRRITSPASKPEEKRPKLQGRCAIFPTQKIGKQSICARNVKSSYVCKMWFLFVKNVCVCLKQK